MARLDEVRTHRLAVVSAPAGCGKTTLVAQWARDADLPVAWYRAEEADGAPGRLLEHIGRSVARGWSIDFRTESDFVALAAESIGSPVVVVVDDTHLLDAASASDLERIVATAPDNLLIVLIGRRPMSINLARSELPPAVHMVADDLRFRTWEIDRLFDRYYQRRLQPDDAAALGRWTEGWAAALQLFDLATQRQSSSLRHQAVRALGSRPLYAQDYLSSQVLAGLPPELSEFMRLTSVFDVLTGDRCDRLLGATGSQRMLLDLEWRQALTSTDDGGATFRYHEVLRRHLEAALVAELGGSGARAWFAAAAALLEHDGEFDQAVWAWCKAEEWQTVQRLIADGRPHSSDSGWLSLLPPGLTGSDPWVVLAQAKRLLSDGQLGSADDTARRADALFTDRIGSEACATVTRICARLRPGPHLPQRTWWEAIRAATMRDPGAVADEAHGHVGPGWRTAEGIGRLLAGDTTALGLLRSAADTETDAIAAIAARLTVGVAMALNPADSDAVAEVDAVQQFAERRGYSWVARLCCGIAAARGGEPEDIAVAQSMVTDCVDRGDPWGAAFIEAAVVLATFNSRRRAGFDSLVARVRALDADVLEAWVRALARLAGDPSGSSADTLARRVNVPGVVSLIAQAASPSGVLASDPQLVLTCFGEFRITVDGVPPNIGGLRPRARAALRFLALHAGRPVHREVLAAALWPDLAPLAAMHNLQVSISTVRRTLEPDAGNRPRLLLREGEAYRLALPSGSVSDVRRFEIALDAAEAATDSASALRAALEIYGGDVLPEDGPAEWAVVERDRLRLRASAAAARLAATEFDNGHWGAAVEAARRCLSIDPCQDAAWRTLIDALESEGKIAAASQTRRQYAEVLASLGVPAPIG